MRERDRNIHARGQELVELATRHLPREFEVTGDADAWPLIGTALVSRMTTTLGSILSLQPAQREVDTGILLRSLYEHAVHFAWMGADPSAGRIEEWRKDDLVSRLKADKDVRERGVELLTDEARSELETQVEQLRGDKLILTNLAAAADAYWAGKLPGMGGEGELKSLRGFYAMLYRNYSGVAHPTFRGLNHVVDDLGPTRRQVRLENEYEGNGPYGLATLIFGLALHVAAQTLGWPSPGEINAIFERHP